MSIVFDNNMNAKESLISLGLSVQEADVYTALLKQGGASASVLARDIGMKRTTAYAVLKNLTEKGFSSVYFRSGKRVYHAQKPHKIASLVEQKLQNFNEAIPFFESMDRSQTQKLGLRFVESKGELQKFYDEVLIDYKNKEYCVIGSTPSWESIDPDYFVKFREKRAKANIQTKLLLTADSKKDNPLDKNLLRQVRFLPKQYSFKSTLDIFDDKVLIVSPDLASLAVIVAVPTMVDIFKSIFEMLWDNVSEMD